jgi:leucyl aminopeptidase
VPKLVAVSGAPEARATDLIAFAVFLEEGGARGSATASAAEGRTAVVGAEKRRQKNGSSTTTKQAKKSISSTRGVSQKRKSSFVLPASLQHIDAALDGLLSDVSHSEGFTGAAGQTLHLHTHGRLPAARVLLIGLGSVDKVGPDTFRRFAGTALRAAEKCKAKKVVVVVPDDGTVRLETRVQAAAEGALLASYRFDKYLTKDRASSTIETIEFALSSRVSVEDALTRARAVADGVSLARDLVNEPPGVLTPVEFARRAVDVGRASGLKVVVLDEKALAREGMGMLLAVAKAASPYTPPRVVRLEYRPKKKARKHIVLVGKGLTFDSGGLDIKPADGMLDMKVDMSGAAAVLGAMVALGRIRPDIAVTGYLGCVENGIGGNAYHPGDILKSRKGLTVEINNTDAEGRLVLGDCIDLAITEQKPDLLIDLATLTGACMVALGPSTAGLFTDDDALAEDIKTIGKRNGEDFWRLPLNDDLLGQLKSPIADMKNTGLRYGGAITAALFLKQFVDKRTSWAHLDIAGPATTDKDADYMVKGGAGFGVRTLVGLIDPT